LGGNNLAKAQLTDLPFTTKAELLAEQQRNPPYGRMHSLPLEQYPRLHQTSGTTTGQPLRWLDTAHGWNAMLGCWGRIFQFVRLQPQDRLFFAFSFGPFLGFWTAFEAAIWAKYFTLSGGGMSSTARLRAIQEHCITVVFCTPTYALHLVEVAVRQGIDL